MAPIRTLGRALHAPPDPLEVRFIPAEFGRDEGTRALAHEHCIAPRFADTAEVALRLQPDEPVFCFSAAVLEAQLARFCDGFPGEISYAVKANAGDHVVATLGRGGLRLFDIASPDEIEDVRELVPDSRFNYHNPVKSRSEIAYAWRRGVRRFAADDLQEIEKILGVIAPGRGIEIAVRFRLDGMRAALHDFTTKFGAPTAQAAQLLRRTAALGFAPVLTFHPGSQCLDPDAYAEHIRAAAAIAESAGVRLAVLNVGGGFPAEYPNRPVPPLERFFAAIRNAAEAAFSGEPPRLECEPGRALVASAVSLITRVKLVKPASREVYLNDGIYGALMEPYQMPEIVPPHRVLRQGQVLAGDMMPCTIYGPTCDPLDRLPQSYDLPADLAEGDFVEFALAGAYGAATSTRFNGYGEIMTVPVRAVWQGQ
jgi:ornithine decarboxylase